MANTDTALTPLVESSRAGLASIGSLFEQPSNLSATTRAAYVVGGLGLAALSVQPRPNPLLNVLALAGGAYLAWSGYKGYCPIKAAFLDGGASDGANARIDAV